MKIGVIGGNGVAATNRLCDMVECNCVESNSSEWMLLQDLLSTFQIFGCVNADSLNFADAHLDFVAILQPAELFERFCQFEA